MTTMPSTHEVRTERFARLVGIADSVHAFRTANTTVVQLAAGEQQILALSGQAVDAWAALAKDRSLVGAGGEHMPKMRYDAGLRNAEQAIDNLDEASRHARGAGGYDPATSPREIEQWAAQHLDTAEQLLRWSAASGGRLPA